MHSMLDGFYEMHARVLKLEKQNLRIKQFGAVALVIVASMLVMGQGSLKKTIEADEFILRDKSGNVRARLSMNAALGNPEMLLFDENGKARVKLAAGIAAATFFGGGISVFDTQGRERGVLSANDSGAFLSLLDLKGLPTTGIGQGHVDTNEFILKDEGGDIRARLFMTAKGTENMTLPGTTTSFPVTHNPTPMLALYDEKGKARVFLDGDGYINGGTIAVSDSQGHALGTFTAMPDYGAMLALDNGKGEQRLFMEPGHLEVSDDEGFKAGLGVEKNLVTPRTGATHQTSAASLILFDRNKSVIWRAP